MILTGAARLIAMIGSPIAQARSPSLFNSHFEALGLDCAVIPIELGEQAIGDFFRTVRGWTNCIGVILTIPYKRAALSHVDETTARAALLGAINVVRRAADGRLFGDMTDGPGFWNGAETAGFQPAAKNVIMIGGGAAASAIAAEFVVRGGGRITAICRDADEEQALSQTLCAEASFFIETPVSLHDFDMLINATPIGMAYAPGLPLDRSLIETLPSSALVADVITDPAQTELLRLAAARGNPTLGGEAMTRGQFQLLAAALGIPLASSA